MWQKMIEKLLSGRYFQSVIFSTTYCICIVGSLILAIKKIISVEVFLALFAGFTPMVILINEWYFKREDRAKNGGKK